MDSLRMRQIISVSSRHAPRGVSFYTGFCLCAGGKKGGAAETALAVSPALVFCRGGRQVLEPRFAAVYDGVVFLFSCETVIA